MEEKTKIRIIKLQSQSANLKLRVSSKYALSKKVQWTSF